MTQLFFVITLLLTAISCVTAAEPIPWWWEVVSMTAFIVAVVGSLAVMVYGAYEMIKFKRNHRQNLIFIVVLSLFWLVILGSVIF